MKHFKFYLIAVLLLIGSNLQAQVTNSESFDGTTFVPAGWTNLYISGSTSATWQRGTGTSHPSGYSTHSGAGLARFLSWSYSSTVRALVTPSFDLSGVGSNTATVKLWVFRDNGYSTSTDKIDIYVNTSVSMTGATSLGTIHRSRSLSPTESSNGWYQYSFNIPGSFNGNTNYVIIRGTSDYGNDVYIDDVEWTAFPPPCTGTPNPGNTVSSTSATCPNTPFTLSLANTISGGGVTYQWQSSSNGTTWSNISGANSSTHTTTQSANTYYRCFVSCTNSSQSSYSTSLQVTTNSFITCYCIPPIGGQQTYDGCQDDDMITNVTFGTLNNSSTCTSNSTTIAYTDYGGSVAAPNLNIGSSYTFSVTCENIWGDNHAVWIDYDHSGTFDASEFVGLGTTNGNNTPQTLSTSIGIPQSAMSGITKMRVKNRYSTTQTGTSSCTGYDYGECEDYNINLVCPSIAITTNPSNSTICPGANTTFTAASTGFGLSYQWQVNTGSGWSNVSGSVYSNTSSATLNITGATAGMDGYKYRCIATNSCGSTATTDGNATLSIRPGPTVTSHPSSVQSCWGGNVSFTAAGSGYGTLTYQWQENTGSGWANISNGGLYSNATTATLNITNVNGSMDGYTYRCIIGDGCSSTTNTNSATLTLYAAPVVNTHPVDRDICIASNTTFSVSGTAAGINYQWYVNTGSSWSALTNTGVYSGVTTATLSITGATVGMSGYMYRCVVGNLCAVTTTSNAATLKVSNALTINSNPVSTTACVGVVSSMSISATGVPTVTYQWQVNTGSGWSNVSNGAVYSGTTTNTITFNSPTLSMNGYMYRCIATNACGTPATSATATLTVATAATVTTQPTDQVVCNGAATTSFVSAATSSAPINYQWQRLAYGSTWVNINNGNHNGGNYSGVTTNTLTVNNATPVISGSKYRCVYNTGCIPATLSNTVTITVNEAPAISATSTNQTICEGQGASFFVNASGAGLVYQWQVNSGSGWSNLSNGGGYANVTSNLMTISATPIGFNGNQYRCVVTGTCAPTTVISTPSTLTVYAPVVITSQPKASDSFCSGGSTTIPMAATGTGLSYQWYISNGSTSTALTNAGVYSGVTTNTLSINGITESNNYTEYKYYCIISGSCNNVASSVSTIKVLGKPTITASPANKVACDNNSTNIKVQAKGGNLTYQWQVNSGSGWSNVSNTGVYSGANTNTLIMSPAVTSMSGNQYRCQVSGTCTPSVTSGVSTLTVHANLSPSVTISSTNTDICTGTSITFTANASNAGTSPSYQWYKNGSPVGANSSTYTSSSWSNNDEMKCRITSSYICPTSPTALSNGIVVKVTQYSTPTIGISSSSGNVECSGIPVTFKAAITNGGTPPHYEWQINGNMVGSNIDNYVTSSLNDGDQVRCILTSSLKCPSPKTVTSNTITMTINKTTKSSIVIAANPDTSICAGDEVTLYSFFTNGGATPKYQWIRNGTDIPGETNATLKTNLLKDGDLIECRFISSALCVFPEVSKGFTFDVGQLVTPQVDVNVSYNGGNNYTFTATAQNGGNNPQFQWFKNGALIQGVTGTTYTTATLEKYDKIYVKMISSHECVTAKTVDSRNITTGVGNINSNTFSDLGLYPNPNTGHFSITGKLKKAVTNKEIVVRITNTVGQTVYQQVYPANGSNIDLQVDLKEHIANGTYSASVIIDGDITNIRFVLNR